MCIRDRIDRFGLSSAIKEGCINARGDIIAVMDSDGQHEVRSLFSALDYISKNNEDMVIGSRFLKRSSIEGLSKNRREVQQLLIK